MKLPLAVLAGQASHATSAGVSVCPLEMSDFGDQNVDGVEFGSLRLDLGRISRTAGKQGGNATRCYGDS